MGSLSRDCVHGYRAGNTCGTHRRCMRLVRREAWNPSFHERKEDIRVKQITAIIRPNRLDEVKQHLVDIGVQGLTVEEVRGFGRQRGHTEVYRGSEYSVDFVPKMLVTILASDNRVDQIIQAILRAARTGVMGDGKICVTPVEDVIRIRNGEQGDAAI